ncbi:inositol monophosphatase [Sulfitobacter albidus]|uniref:Inositol-1-monophosphatase n=1 Tax=Sulfitobacter albidus TaxID=2829501 RepID=A0A975JB95_9RHOB|nr:inositol monophosphatase family protein [Sulfitobacter albidus]QUJ75263.1 inositol monophosphatase [Sulfitobacter albidus]
MNGSANLNVMQKAARKAGRSLVKDFREVESLQASVRGAEEFVRKADAASEKILREELRAARGTYGWLTKGATTEEGEDPTRRWIVDPLDGSTNFQHGLAHWGISIALEHKGQIVAGVVYDAAKDEMFFAEKGAGAWMNDTRLRVSGRARMIESMFATGIPYAGRADLPMVLQDIARLAPTCAGIRRFGCAALDLAYVAAGRYEGFWERRLNAWDMAAGMILVREAGGFVEPIKTDGNILEDGEILACNEAISRSFAKAVRGKSA